MKQKLLPLLISTALLLSGCQTTSIETDQTSPVVTEKTVSPKMITLPNGDKISHQDFLVGVSGYLACHRVYNERDEVFLRHLYEGLLNDVLAFWSFSEDEIDYIENNVEFLFENNKPVDILKACDDNVSQILKQQGGDI
ncbi:membrane lipoprotein [Vibrio phage 1.101.O._10N.261.45.C6]|nr:membrane lipoprotein [Vibrio phage 1.101.O._10N.261.45.C6]